MRVCSTCMWWGGGDCHRYPTALKTDAGHWCGEHTSRRASMDPLQPKSAPLQEKREIARGLLAMGTSKSAAARLSGLHLTTIKRMLKGQDDE